MRNKLFTQPGCRYCSEARTFLDSHSVIYAELDVTADDTALRDLLALTGRIEVPVLFSGYQAVIGFDVETWTDVLRKGALIQANDPYRLPESVGRDPHDDE